MLNCQYLGERCANWAQWRAKYPDDKTVRVYCNLHKEELDEQQAVLNADDRIKFTFVGSVPDGVDVAKLR